MVASQDTYFDTELSVLLIKDATTFQNLSPYVKELRGLPGQFKVNDLTTFGSKGERPGPSIFIVHFSVEFLFNMVTSVGVHTVLNAIWAGKLLRAFEYYPAGQTAGNAKIYGNAYLPIYEITSRVGDYVTAHAEFHADNGVTSGEAA